MLVYDSQVCCKLRIQYLHTENRDTGQIEYRAIPVFEVLTWKHRINILQCVSIYVYIVHVITLGSRADALNNCYKVYCCHNRAAAVGLQTRVTDICTLILACNNISTPDFR